MSKVAEKKIINEKIARVREVVHGVSTNDIILALYSLDMNVERTIQAFCEGGASEILDDWVRPAGSSSKNKNKKKKKSQQVEPESGTATVAPSTASASKVAKAPPQHEPKQADAPPAPLPAKTEPQTNGFVIQAKPHETKPQADKSIPVTEQIQQTFKALRAAVTDREKALLATCGANSKFVDANFDHLISLIHKFGSVTDTSSKAPSGAPTSTAPVGMPKAVSPVQAAAIKHATSQSSISSSLGADSGVNLSPTHKDEKKPVSESKPKPAAKVVSGGIQMQSDALTSEQLEALQRSLAEQLAAFGIDASVLSGVTGGDMPVRRPRKPDGARRGGAAVRNERTAPLRPQLSIL